MATHNYDEITCRNMANAQRGLDQWDEEVRAIQEQKAIANGFSNYEEYKKSEDQRCMELHAQYIAALEEECKVLGKTREQLDAEDPQRWVSPDWPECNCEGACFTLTIARS